MYDCNLIKSRAQKKQDYRLPSLEATYKKMQMPMTPGMPTFPLPTLPTTPTTPQAPTVPPTTPQAPAMPSVPMAPTMPQEPREPSPNPLMPPSLPGRPATPAPPTAPSAPTLPPVPPEPEQAFPRSPLLPRVLPTSPSIAVPANPLLPPEYASILDYESLQYMNGYLRTQIGNYVEVEFLVGSTNIVTKFGRLIGVGLNYILIEDLTTGDILSCDFYNIKFFRTHNISNHLTGIRNDGNAMPGR